MKKELFYNSKYISKKSVILLMTLLVSLTKYASAENTIIKGGQSSQNGSNMFEVFIQNNTSEPIKIIDLNNSERKNGAVEWIQDRSGIRSIPAKQPAQMALICNMPRYGEDIIFPPTMRWQSGVVLIGESSGFFYGRIYLTSGRDLIKSNNLITSNFKNYFTTPSDLTIQYDNKCLYSYENHKETDQSKKLDVCITIGAMEWDWDWDHEADRFVFPYTAKLRIIDMDQRETYGLRVHIPITINSVPTEVSP